MAKKSGSGNFGFRVTEMFFDDEDGKNDKFIKLDLGNETVRIPTDTETYTNFKAEFVRGAPLDTQL